MSTEVETGNGSEFWLDSAGGVPTLLGEVFNIPIPSGAAALLDASHYGSVGFKDYIVSPLQDGEEADIEMNWVPGSATDALCRAAKGATRDFRMVVPVDGGTWEFTGQCLIRDYKRTNPNEEKRTGTLTVKWVGEITEAAGA